MAPTFLVFEGDMTTASQIQSRARGRMGILAKEEPYEAVDQATDFTLLTSMLNQWALDGAISSFTAAVVTDEVVLTFADATTLQDEAEFALVANFAVRLSAELRLPLPQVVIADSAIGYDTILRKQHLASDVTESSYDTALSYMPSQRLKRAVTS